jgi:hypothetical protein
MARAIIFNEKVKTACDVAGALTQRKTSLLSYYWQGQLIDQWREAASSGFAHRQSIARRDERAAWF